MKHRHSPIYDAVKRIFGSGRSGGAERELRERLLEDQVVDYFTGAGIPVRRQVYCGEAGWADVVTDDTIFELKDILSSRRVLQQALGQLFLYKRYLDHCAKTAIICNSSKIPRLGQIVRLTGVEVYVWQGGDSFLVTGPPWRPPFKGYSCILP